MKLFPPLVTGTGVCLIGLTLLPVAIDWAAGGSGAVNYGDLIYISIAGIVLIITLILNIFVITIRKNVNTLLTYSEILFFIQFTFLTENKSPSFIIFYIIPMFCP